MVKFEKYILKLFIRFYLSALLCFVFIIHVSASNDTLGVNITGAASLYIHPGASIHIASSITNGGELGLYKGSTLVFSGKSWLDYLNATYPDEGGKGSFSLNGGDVIFKTGINGSYKQWLRSEVLNVYPNTGSTFFPNLIVDNPEGVYLTGVQSTGIRRKLHFETGKLVLGATNLYIGSTAEAQITGYTNDKYIQTNDTAQTGFLYRKFFNSSNGNLVFPIGTTTYEPLSLMANTSSAINIKAKVFDGVYAKAQSGTVNPEGFVKKTWLLGIDSNVSAAVVLAVQHADVSETAGFSNNRQKSYITNFQFANNKWDTIPVSEIQTPGTITTGTLIPGSYLHTRTISLNGLMYFSKTASANIDSFVLAKTVSKPVRNPDNSYILTYTLLINNISDNTITNLALIDSLSTVFSPQQVFNVMDVTASGQLVVNSAYDGKNDFNLLLANSKMSARKIDTIVLRVHLIPNGIYGTFYNSASVKANSVGQSGSFSFEAKSQNGIDASNPGLPASATDVSISPGKYIIPGGFSPNGDGINDYFRIPGVGGEKQKIEIYNRYGKLVYKNDDYKNNWDGYSNQPGVLFNSKLSVGTYYYVYTVVSQGASEKYIGFLSLWY